MEARALEGAWQRGQMLTGGSREIWHAISHSKDGKMATTACGQVLTVQSEAKSPFEIPRKERCLECFFRMVGEVNLPDLRERYAGR